MVDGASSMLWRLINHVGYSWAGVTTARSPLIFLVIDGLPDAGTHIDLNFVYIKTIAQLVVDV